MIEIIIYTDSKLTSISRMGPNVFRFVNRTKSAVEESRAKSSHVIGFDLALSAHAFQYVNLYLPSRSLLSLCPTPSAKKYVPAAENPSEYAKFIGIWPTLGEAFRLSSSSRLHV
jgi:hypothetical protein